MARVLDVWSEHLVHPSLPQTMASRMRSAGFTDVRAQGHLFTTTEFTEEALVVGLLRTITSFVAGRGGVTEDEAHEWEEEQHQLGRRGEFFFCYTQFCFSGVNPAS
jgi:hypothetical protein